jgi:tetratricopeptide (TPR) repeat protein
MEPATPKKIDKYDVVGLIARGGMGVVYKAVDRSLDRFVAIKMVTSADEEHSDLLKRFYREAQFTANLRHSNIVTVYDLGDFGGTPYLVMEYLSGKNLDSTLEEQSMTLQQRLNCIGQVCNGLQYAHSRQPSIVHRDIKPANIMVAEDGTAKIIDFGIARFGQSRNTRTGFVMGSYHYMSPEQVNGAELDGRSDIFSTGVVLYQLLTKALPFEGSTIAETLQNVVCNPPPPLNQFLKEYPARLDDVLARALAKNREERYQSASEFAFDLSEIEEELKRGFFGGYLERAEGFLGNGEYERAKQELVCVLEVDRQHARANDLMRKVQRATARRQRKTRVLHLREHAEEALKLNRLNQALSYLDQAVRLDPTDAKLNVFRERVSAMRARAERVNEILARAERACAADDLAEADRAVTEALQFDPDSARAKSFRTILEGKRAERERSSPAQGWVSARSNEAGKARQQREAAQFRQRRPEGAGASRWQFGQCDSAEPDPIWSDGDVGLPSLRPAPTPANDQRGVDQSVADIPPVHAALWAGRRADAHGDEVTAAFDFFDAAQGGMQESVAALSDADTSGDYGPVADPVEHQERAATELQQSQPAAGWPEDTLRAAEKQLAGFIGPLAKVMVKKAAARTTNSDEFYTLLAAGIERPSDREDFLAAVSYPVPGGQTETGPPMLPAELANEPQSSEAGLALTPAAVERAARLLAQYVGPLSGVLTKKAAQRADSLRALYLLLAEHVGTESERDHFLQDAGFPNR